MSELSHDELLRQNTYLKQRVAQLQADVTDLSAEAQRLRQALERVYGAAAARKAEADGG